MFGNCFSSFLFNWFTIDNAFTAVWSLEIGSRRVSFSNIVSVFSSSSQRCLSVVSSWEIGVLEHSCFGVNVSFLNASFSSQQAFSDVSFREMFGNCFSSFLFNWFTIDNAFTAVWSLEIGSRRVSFSNIVSVFSSSSQRCLSVVGSWEIGVSEHSFSSFLLNVASSHFFFSCIFPFKTESTGSLLIFGVLKDWSFLCLFTSTSRFNHSTFTAVLSRDMLLTGFSTFFEKASSSHSFFCETPTSSSGDSSTFSGLIKFWYSVSVCLPLSPLKMWVSNTSDILFAHTSSITIHFTSLLVLVQFTLSPFDGVTIHGSSFIEVFSSHEYSVHFLSVSLGKQNLNANETAGVKAATNETITKGIMTLFSFVDYASTVKWKKSMNSDYHFTVEA